MFTLFYVIFLERMCLRCFIGSFTSEYVCAVLCYFSRAAVFALFHGTFMSGYVYAVFWHLIICLR